MSGWGAKLTAKLNTLMETSSKESQQTLAQWIGFNRKHASAFADALAAALSSSSASVSRRNVLLSVVHEVIMLEKQTNNTAKWEKLADLRTVMGETILRVADQLHPERLSEYLEQWDTGNVFGGPTLIHQIKRKIAQQKELEETKITSNKETESQNQAMESVKQEEPSVEHEEEQVSTEPPLKQRREEQGQLERPEPVSTKDIGLASPLILRENTRVSPSAAVAVEYDFEKSNIPQRSVEPKEFLEPCRAIATLQIARDLSNDAALQLSSLLSGLPQDIRSVIAESAEQGGLSSKELLSKIDEATLRDYTMRTPASLLDMDLLEQLQNIRTFREVITKQMQARKQLVHLLIQSRCQFGADKAAAAFESTEGIRTALGKRTQLLQDAMELEGLDVEHIRKHNNATVKEEEEEALPELSWYQSSTNSKRPKVE
jgi:hypothetical protein